MTNRHGPDMRISPAVNRLITHATSRRDSPGYVWGIPSSIDGYNRITGGFHPGQLTVLGMRTGEGKSSITMQDAFHIADWLIRREQEQGVPAGKVVVFSPEMSVDSILTRHASAALGINSRDVNRGDINEEEYTAWCNYLDGLARYDDYIKFVAGREVEISDIQNTLIDMQASSQISFVVVDYIQLINVIGKTLRDKTTQVAQTLKRLAIQCQVPILAASQVNRPKRDFYRGEEVSTLDRAPQIDELSESSDIEKSADVVVMGHNPGIHKPYEDVVIAEFAIMKNRNEGGHGDYRVRFYPTVQKWLDVTEGGEF